VLRDRQQIFVLAKGRLIESITRAAMANGNSGDHPLTDIFAHKLEVYGPEADDLIRKIAGLCSPRELDEWWAREIGWSPDRDVALQKARSRYNELLRRRREGGWEA